MFGINSSTQQTCPAGQFAAVEHSATYPGHVPPWGMHPVGPFTGTGIQHFSVVSSHVVPTQSIFVFWPELLVCVLVALDDDASVVDVIAVVDPAEEETALVAAPPEPVDPVRSKITRSPQLNDPAVRIRTHPMRYMCPSLDLSAKVSRGFNRQAQECLAGST